MINLVSEFLYGLFAEGHKSDLRRNPETGEREILGVGLLSREHAVPSEAELSVLVSDRFQRQGLGTVLLERLLEIGRAEGLHRITADILFDNRPVQRLFKKLGFHLRRDHEEGVVKADLDLYQAVQPKISGSSYFFPAGSCRGKHQEPLQQLPT